MKKVLILLLIVVAAGVAGWWFFLRRPAEAETSQYTFVEVERGDLESLVSATGTLAALQTVQVGTQVSGTISKVLVDFNDRVKQGQLLAVIDPSLLDAAVRDAEAGLDKTRAQLSEAQSQLEQNEPLFTQGLISRQDVLPLRTAVTTAKAGVVSADATLDRAKRNRVYAEIRSPIDGVVIARQVDPGQTVAASFSTPTLFTIAQDLSRMQILAQVDETDIGQVKVGQSVRFTVPAYPDKTFAGTVREIRLQPETVQNVVDYTVVVDAANPDGVLLPGMTATADFVVQQVQDVLKVAGAALRLRPTPEMLAALRSQRQASGGSPGAGRHGGGAAGASAPGDGVPGGGPPGGGPPGGGPSGGFAGGGKRPTDVAMLWSVDAAGALQATPVRIGPSDGFETAITPLRGGVEAGMKVISGIAGATAASNNGPPRGGMRRLGF
jgi:HlyD family secretion protein